MQPGAGVLEFTRVGNRTVVTGAMSRSPLRFLTPRNQGAAAWVYSSSLGGGLVGGDRLAVKVRVGAGAEGVLLTQGSTKVYRGSEASGQTLEARVESGGLLALLPDPVVCFAGSTYAQSQKIELERDGSLLLVDMVTSGRYASGERWRFDGYLSRILVSREGKPLFFDSLRLDAGAGELAQRQGRFNALGVAVLTGPAWAVASRELLAEVATHAPRGREDLVVSASPLGPDGAVLRLAATATEPLVRALRARLSFLPKLLGDDPWARSDYSKGVDSDASHTA